MISPVASGQINPAEIILVGQSSSRKVSLPVHSTQSILSQFKYVRGIPVSSADPGVPITKLKLLNNLIQSINSIYSNKSIPEINSENNIERSEQGQQAIIEKAAKTIQYELAELKNTNLSVSQFVDTSGSLFSTSA